MTKKPKKGDAVIYKERLHEVIAVNGRQVTIHAPQVRTDVSIDNYHLVHVGDLGGKTPQQLIAKHLGARLVGKPFVATTPQGKKFNAHKMVVPKATRTVDFKLLSTL